MSSGPAWFAAGESEADPIDDQLPAGDDERETGGPSRASFGFPAGPISPARQAADPPAPVVLPTIPPAPVPADVPARADRSAGGWPPPERMDRADLGRVPGRPRPVAGRRPGTGDERPDDLAGPWDDVFAEADGGVDGGDDFGEPAVWPTRPAGDLDGGDPAAADWAADAGTGADQGMRQSAGFGAASDWAELGDGSGEMSGWPAQTSAGPDGRAGGLESRAGGLDEWTGGPEVRAVGVGGRVGRAGTRIGEQRPEHASVDTGARRPTPDASPRRSRAVSVAVVLLSTVALLSGTAVGVVFFAGGSDKLQSVLHLGAADAAPRTVTAPLENRTTARLEVLAGANLVRVRFGELDDDLYRISTPEDAGFTPSPEIRDDDVTLHVSRDGDGTGREIEVVLSAKVRWALRFAGYAEQEILDLSGGQVSGVELAGGVRRAELSLAKSTGTVAVTVNGAVEQLRVKSPAASPVRVRVGGGARTVVAGSRTIRDLPAGSTLTPKNWATPHRYDLTAAGRITSLTVESA